MGFTAGSGTKGLDTFNGTPQTVADLNRLVALIARVGNYRVESTSTRDAITGTARYEGLTIYNTTTDQIEVYTGTGWSSARDLIAKSSPAVRVSRSSAHTSGSPFQTNGGTFRLNWDAEPEDPFGFHDLGTNPERLTVPSGMSGVYTYWAKTRVEDNGADECLFFLDKNGVKVEYTEMALQGGFYKRGMISGEIQLNAGDWVAYAVNKPGAAANLTPAQSAFGLRWERP